MIYRSPFPDVTIPDVGLADFIIEGARTRGAAIALIDGISGVEVSYADLVLSVEALAAGLARWGLRPREVVALVAANRLEYPAVLLAVALLGATVTTVNPSYTEGEIAKQLADAQPVLAIAGSEVAAAVRAAAGESVREVIEIDRLRDLAESRGQAPPAEIDPAQDVAVLPYSSGTTGAPKGVMLTHRNLVAMQRLLDPVEGTGPDDVVMAVLPFFHIYGLSVILLRALHRGAKLVVLPRFEMESFLRAVERHRVTRLPLVPPILLRLAQEPRLDDFDVSSVRTVMSGAAPLAPEIADRLSRRLGGCLVKQGYGLTELSPGGHMHPEDGSRPPPGSVGLMHPNTECRIVDPVSGQDVAPGTAGEIWYRGPQVMKGYLGRPDATAEMITPDGWLRTGDIGRIDAAGQLYVVDRLKELIKYKGFQVAPAELEAVLLSHPSVADAAVIPKPDVEAGELPKAYVVLAPGAVADAADLLAYVARQVAGFKQVREIEFVDSIPKSPSGKVLRRVLIERELAAQGRRP